MSFRLAATDSSVRGRRAEPHCLAFLLVEVMLRDVLKSLLNLSRFLLLLWLLKYSIPWAFYLILIVKAQREQLF